MKRTETWKVLTLGAALSCLAGLGLVSAGTAVADTGGPAPASRVIAASVGANGEAPRTSATFAQQGCANVGAFTTQCGTSGHSQIVTTPNPYVGSGGYGPFFFKHHRGWGGGL